MRGINGVPVLDGCGAAVKFGEFLVEIRNMGIDRSRIGLYAAPSKGGVISHTVPLHRVRYPTSLKDGKPDTQEKLK